MANYEIRKGADMGAALAELRRQLGLNQHDAGVRAGIDPNYLSKIESGRSVSLLEHELRIFRRLGARVVVEFPAIRDE
ncbi:MAG: helix-turn-helix transcriptional regulator [Microthrixaceae bacterium]